MFELSDREYKYISSRVYDYEGINLTEQKRPLIISRLAKRIRTLGLSGFPQYVDYLKNDETGKEFQILIDAVSTNYSLFFRENHHLEFLNEKILPGSVNRDLKIWSAASSTGQEIYSIVMTIMEFERENNVRLRYSLYASDISRDALTKASAGIFNSHDIKGIPPPIVKRYFLKGTGENEDLVKVRKELIAKIRFFRLNLTDRTYRLPPMDVIFLRNAIIYFDIPTKTELIDRLHNYLKPGGYLILGHSESLAGISEKFELKGKTIYRRID